MRKYVCAAILTGLLSGASYSGDVLIPYIKSGGNWVSLVSYFTQNAAYNGGNKLHFIYWYKKDWSGFDKIVGSLGDTPTPYNYAECQEYNIEVASSLNDFTTVDVSFTNALEFEDNVLGKKEGYDTKSPEGVATSPKNSEFSLASDNVVDAYLIIQDGVNTEFAGLGIPKITSAEAVVFDMVTGMFFYQYGIDVYGSMDPNQDTNFNDRFNRFGGQTSVVMFQGTDFADTSVYYIPVGAPQVANQSLTGGNSEGCVHSGSIGLLPPSVGASLPPEYIQTSGAFNRQEDHKSGGKKVCARCLALIPIKYFMSDSLWNTVKKGGGVIFVTDSPGGVTYKGEVYRIGTKPNIFAPLKSYENSLAFD